MREGFVACAIENCPKRRAVRGWCSAHYRLWQLHGKPERLDRETPSHYDRFWGFALPQEGCWEWSGYTSRDGYPRLSISNDPKRIVLAHRVSYELHKGPIPEGLQIDHLCHNKSCTNPDHLEAVTGAENTRRWWTYKRAQHVA